MIQHITNCTNIIILLNIKLNKVFNKFITIFITIYINKIFIFFFYIHIFRNRKTIFEI